MCKNYIKFNRFQFFALLMLTPAIIYADPFEQLNIDFLKQHNQSYQTTNKKNKKEDLPPYRDIANELIKIEGLFDFFWDVKKNNLFISIKPQQLNITYLANITRQSGDAYYYDGSSMLDEFPFQFNRIANNIHLSHINLLFRANKEKAISKAIKNDFSNSIVAESKIVSLPHPETGAVLVNANKLFLKDHGYVSQHRNGKYNFDLKNSYFISIQSFVSNSELELSIHYKSSKETNAFTLPNSRSMSIKYHISLSTIPVNNFSPRIADDRVGYFTTIYQDYTNTMQETQYVRLINKWNLIKKNQHSLLSEPINPIIFWIENKVPEEFRSAVKEGIESWNIAFEKIGFKNAIIAKQMPDDATWNPADVRYNTIRWIIQPGSGYAVGPSRANPFTGELYDADIRISADFVRGFYKEFDEFVNPVTSDELTGLWINKDDSTYSGQCNYSNLLHEQMSIGWHKMITNNYIDGSDLEIKEYIDKGLIDLVLHEVGHTLGLRHNFKASSIFSIEQLSNKEFTKEFGISGSVMDYHPINLFDQGHTVFQTKPGPYDVWAIEYGYSEFNEYSEKKELENIAAKSNHPLLTYGTDEDTFGRSSRGIDPLCSLWDLSNDPIGYYDNQLTLVNNLWDNLIYKFKVDGNRYQKIRSVFSQGVGEYIHAGISAPKFIGGIYFNRNHIGDPNEKYPFVLVPAIKQRDALDFIIKEIFNKDAFNFNPELLNMLSPERHEDFNDSVWKMDRIDYPIHRVVSRIHGYTLYSLFHPRRLTRIQDNELKTEEENQFTLQELFYKVNNSIWAELKDSEAINSYRRELQKTYVNMLSNILYSNFYFTNDAIALARINLSTTLKKIYDIIGSPKLDQYTKAHLQNTSNRIEKILNAKMQIN